MKTKQKRKKTDKRFHYQKVKKNERFHYIPDWRTVLKLESCATNPKEELIVRLASRLGLRSTGIEQLLPRMRPED